MKKLIDLNEEMVKNLKTEAGIYGLSFKKYLEMILRYHSESIDEKIIRNHFKLLDYSDYYKRNGMFEVDDVFKELLDKHIKVYGLEDTLEGRSRAFLHIKYNLHNRYDAHLREIDNHDLSEYVDNNPRIFNFEEEWD